MQPDSESESFRDDLPMDPRTFQALALAKGLELYARTGMKPNTLWTPKNMLATASRLTGKPYKRRDYIKAASDLRAAIAEKEKN